MATLKEKWDAIELTGDYVPNSLILKDADQRGAVFKWLINVDGIANRKERFFILTGTELSFWDNTVVSEIDVVPAT